MSRCSVLAIPVLGLILFPASATAQSPDASARGQIVALENRWLKGLGDSAVLQEVLAPDFVHVLPSGTITRDEQIAWVKAHPAPAGIRRRFEGLTVRVYGDAAVVNGAVIATAPNGVRKTYFTDVFVRRDGRWVAVNAQENEAPAP